MTTIGQSAQTYPFGPVERLELHPHYAELRSEQPLTRIRMPYGGEAWLATRYADAKVVLGDPRFSRGVTVGADVPRARPLVEYETNLLNMDPPDHSRLRTLVAKAFTARRVELLRPRTQAIVDGLLDRMIESARPADLAEFLAWPLPITVICELLGVPVADREEFRRWTETTLALGHETSNDAILAAKNQLDEYMARLIAQRRVQPADDLLTALVAARDNEDRLSENELVMLGVAVLIAGHETTANQIGNFVYTLLTQPKYWAQLVAEPDLVPPAVEELLRYTPLGASVDMPRIATQDVELGGQLVRTGEAVLVQVHSANRDEAVFPHAEEIDFSRPSNPHIGFGHGVHHCLGAPLARMELRAAISTLVRRLPTLRLAVPAEEVPWRTDRLVRGVRALPVTW